MSKISHACVPLTLIYANLDSQPRKLLRKNLEFKETGPRDRIQIFEQK
jgi:hypothetical protein